MQLDIIATKFSQWCHVDLVDLVPAILTNEYCLAQDTLTETHVNIVEDRVGNVIKLFNVL